MSSTAVRFDPTARPPASFPKAAGTVGVDPGFASLLATECGPGVSREKPPAVAGSGGQRSERRGPGPSEGAAEFPNPRDVIAHDPESPGDRAPRSDSGPSEVTTPASASAGRRRSNTVPGILSSAGSGSRADVARSRLEADPADPGPQCLSRQSTQAEASDDGTIQGEPDVEHDSDGMQKETRASAQSPVVPVPIPPPVIEAVESEKAQESSTLDILGLADIDPTNSEPEGRSGRLNVPAEVDAHSVPSFFREGSEESRTRLEPPPSPAFLAGRQSNGLVPANASPLDPTIETGLLHPPSGRPAIPIAHGAERIVGAPPAGSRRGAVLTEVSAGGASAGKPVPAESVLISQPDDVPVAMMRGQVAPGAILASVNSASASPRIRAGSDGVAARASVDLIPFRESHPWNPSPSIFPNPIPDIPGGSPGSREVAGTPVEGGIPSLPPREPSVPRVGGMRLVTANLGSSLGAEAKTLLAHPPETTVSSPSGDAGVAGSPQEQQPLSIGPGSMDGLSRVALLGSTQQARGEVPAAASVGFTAPRPVPEDAVLKVQRRGNPSASADPGVATPRINGTETSAESAGVPTEARTGSGTGSSNQPIPRNSQRTGNGRTIKSTDNSRAGDGTSTQPMLGFGSAVSDSDTVATSVDPRSVQQRPGDNPGGIRMEKRGGATAESSGIGFRSLVQFPPGSVAREEAWVESPGATSATKTGHHLQADSPRSEGLPRRMEIETLGQGRLQLTLSEQGDTLRIDARELGNALSGTEAGWRDLQRNLESSGILLGPLESAPQDRGLSDQRNPQDPRHAACYDGGMNSSGRQDTPADPASRKPVLTREPRTEDGIVHKGTPPPSRGSIIRRGREWWA